MDPNAASHRDHLLGLFAEHFSGDGFWELELYATSDLIDDWALRGVPDRDDMLVALTTCVTNIHSCKELLGELIQNHWRMKDIVQ
jgi:hypothetical protein